MIFASNNNGKLREIKAIFSDYELISLLEAGIAIDVVEDADTFLGNATKKAKEIFKLSGIPTIADDSGICLEALDGFPGVLTHRFLGENSTKEERNLDLIRRLDGNPNKNAKIICELVYYDGENIVVGHGELAGVIVPPRGENGFGFDDIFELPNGKTIAELPMEEKNKISARSLAAHDLLAKLKEMHLTRKTM